MSLRRVDFWFVVIATAGLLLSAAAVRAEDADPDSRIDHLVVGDGYFVQVERHGIQQVISGNFTKATDHWIVLHFLSEGRNDVGVPVLSKLPYGNRVFKRVSIGRTDNYVWIPREAATIRGRLRAAKPADFEPPAGDEPSERSACEVTFVGSDHKVADRDGKLLKIAEDRLTLVETEKLSVEVRKPGWSNLPVVGGYFIDTRTETRETLTDIARSDLLCVRVRVANYAGPVPEDQASVRR